MLYFKKKYMIKILSILCMFFTNILCSQNNWKIQADLKKNNSVKESKVFLVEPDKPNEKKLIGTYFYNKQGVEIEQIGYSLNGEIESHYIFKFPNDSTRVFISIDENGEEISKGSQAFKLSDKKPEAKTTSDDGQLRFEYDSNDRMVKVWKIQEEKDLLLTEIFYNKKNLRVKEIMHNGMRGRLQKSVRIIKRKDNGLLETIITKEKGKKDIIMKYEYVKYSI